MEPISRRTFLDRSVLAGGAVAAAGLVPGVAKGSPVGAPQSEGESADELAFKPAVDLATMLREGQISSVELTQHYIDRVEKYDPALNAVVVRDFDRALEAAREADAALARGVVRGALHGLPMTIKEAYNVAGLPTTWGIPAFKGNIAQTDAEVVKRFKAAGALFMGKTNVPFELRDFQSYNEIYGTTNNPWDLERTPGGSSGGSAAALAAGLTGLESGSDIGSSIRNPAHYCGVYGHKPTWGIVSGRGHSLPGGRARPDLAVVGPLARSAEDLALAMNIVAGPDLLDAPGWRLELPPPRATEIKNLRVAIWASDEMARVDQEITARALRIGEHLSRLGATVSDSARPAFSPRESHDTYLNLLMSFLWASGPDEEYEQAKREAATFDPQDTSLAATMARAEVLDHRTWMKYHNAQEGLRQRWKEFFGEWDVVICPALATTAFPHDHHRPVEERTIRVNGEDVPYWEQLFWAGLATVAQLPSTVFPTGLSKDGLPIGLQAVGAEYGDRTTIEFARLMAQEIGGFTPPPGYGG
jgi:amidase